MKHGTRSRYFSRDTAQRKAMFRSLCDALILHGKIKTTVEKAKDERLIYKYTIGMFGVFSKSLAN